MIESSAVVDERSSGCGDRSTPIHFQSADEFQSRPGFITKLVCESSDLSHIVGKYTFGRHMAMRCGLNNCNQRHWAAGYVIRTKDGRETNIGSDCGYREFGVVFEELEARYRAAEDKQAHESVVLELQGVRVELLSELGKLEPQVSKLAFEVNQIIQAIAHDRPLKKVFDEALKEGGNIYVFEAVSEAGQLAMSRGRGETHATVKVRKGALKGIQCVESVAIITRQLKFQAYIPLVELAEPKLRGLSDKDLKKTVTTIKQVREAISDVVRFRNAAQVFCGEANRREMLKLAEAIPRRQRIDRINRTLQKIASGPG